MWSHDITAAPRDGSHVILAMPKNKTLRSYWCKPKNDPEHWCMLSHKDEPLAWIPWPEHPFPESPRKAAEAVAERPASSDATVASGLVEADKAEAVAGGLGQPELIPALTVQHGGVNVGGPERAGVTVGGDESGTAINSEMHQRPSNNDKPCSKVVLQDNPSPAGTGSELLAGREGRHEGEAATAGLPTYSYLEDVGGGA